MRERLNTWAKRTVVALAVAVPGSVAFTFVSFEVSSQPQFCGSCHIMAPYYESWRTSSHNQVPCVDCHVPPGVTSELRKKYEALSMVARYFTGTYSTNPWTEIDDQSCLRSGCHVKRVLLGRELYQGVLFDHQPHLAELRRGKRLRCTSCHSQIVQGSHISVTPSTCFLCHFKNTPTNTGTGRCTLCHAIPEKMITTVGLSFDHGDVKRFRMDCMACHEGIVKGEGDVPPERCLTCHNETERLERFAEAEYLHRTHVADHKVECMNCHMEIRHEVPAREEALATACQTCHQSPAGHSAVRDLYRGIGGKGVEPRPAAMYLAGIRCEGCHNVVPADSGRANEISCMSCHGPKYLTIYRTWQVGLAERLAGARGVLQEVSGRVEQSGNGAGLELVRGAHANIELVERGKAIHNPAYAVALLENSVHRLGAALEAVGEPKPALPWVQAPYAAACLDCHFGIEYLSRPAFGREFPHGTHVVSARLRCPVCHEEMDRHGGMRIDAASCDDCHTRITKPMAGMGADQCLACHPADIGRVSEVAAFPHERHIGAGLECEICHAGVGAGPHLDFARSAAALPQVGHEFCASCHGADVPSADGIPDGAECAKCHPDM